MKRYLCAAFLLALSLSGCFRSIYDVGTGASRAGLPDDKRWRFYFVAGLVGSPTTNVTRICPSGNATVVNRITAANALVAFLTGSIVLPVTITVYCAKGSAPSTKIDIELTPDEAKEIAMSPEFLNMVRQESPELVETVIAAQHQSLKDSQ